MDEIIVCEVCGEFLTEEEIYENDTVCSACMHEWEQEHKDLLNYYWNTRL